MTSISKDVKKIPKTLKKVPIKKYGTRREVFNRTAEMTTGGLEKKNLTKENGRIRSKLAQKKSKRNAWAESVKKARENLKIEGFHLIKKESELYNEAKKIFRCKSV